jgi:hypothetical protein
MKHLILIIISFFFVQDIQAITSVNANKLLAKADALHYTQPKKALSLTKKAMHQYALSGNVTGYSENCFM